MRLNAGSILNPILDLISHHHPNIESHRDFSKHPSRYLTFNETCSLYTNCDIPMIISPQVCHLAIISENSDRYREICPWNVLRDAFVTYNNSYIITGLNVIRNFSINKYFNAFKLYYFSAIEIMPRRCCLVTVSISQITPNYKVCLPLNSKVTPTQ